MKGFASTWWPKGFAAASGRGQPSVASRGSGRSYEIRRGCRGPTPRCCRHPIIPMWQAIEGPSKGGYRAGCRVPAPPCRLVRSVVDRCRRGSHQLKNQWRLGAYPQDSCPIAGAPLLRTKATWTSWWSPVSEMLYRLRKGGDNRLLGPKNQRRRPPPHFNLARYSKVTKDAIIVRVRRQGAVRALAEPHPVVAAEMDGILHGLRRGDVRTGRW